MYVQRDKHTINSVNVYFHITSQDKIKAASLNSFNLPRCITAHSHNTYINYYTANMLWLRNVCNISRTISTSTYILHMPTKVMTVSSTHKYTRTHTHMVAPVAIHVHTYDSSVFLTSLACTEHVKLAKMQYYVHRFETPTFPPPMPRPLLLNFSTFRE